jgi:hypothetical protein
MAAALDAQVNLARTLCVPAQPEPLLLPQRRARAERACGGVTTASCSGTNGGVGSSGGGNGDAASLGTGDLLRRDDDACRRKVTHLSLALTTRSRMLVCE